MANPNPTLPQSNSTGLLYRDSATIDLHLGTIKNIENAYAQLPPHLTYF
jgi:hypothetical protein